MTTLDDLSEPATSYEVRRADGHVVARAFTSREEAEQFIAAAQTLPLGEAHSWRVVPVEVR